MMVVSKSMINALIASGHLPRSPILEADPTPIAPVKTKRKSRTVKNTRTPTKAPDHG